MLTIDPKTPKGQAQLEAIGWAQDQMNTALAQFFGGNWKILRGLKIDFRLGLDLQLNDKIKFDLAFLPPKTEKEFDEAVIALKKVSAFEEEKPIIETAAKNK